MEEVAVLRRLFTVDDYYAMVEAGILGEDDRVELIEGEIITMAPPGLPHSSGVDRLTMLFAPPLAGRAIVRVQNPVRLSDRSEPQPDVALLRFRQDYYAGRVPDARLDDVLLVVEVAHSSLRYDRNVKLPLYARSGVPEVWIVDVEARALDVYREPSADGYHLHDRRSTGDTVRPVAFPDVVLPVGDLLP